MAYSKPSCTYPLTEGSTEGFTETLLKVSVVRGLVFSVRHVRHGVLMALGVEMAKLAQR